jgi:hypothetical protein
LARSRLRRLDDDSSQRIPIKSSGEDRIRTSSQIQGISIDPAIEGAESGALGTIPVKIDSELSKLMDAWPMLPDAIKAGILAMVQAASQT